MKSLITIGVAVIAASLFSTESQAGEYVVGVENLPYLPYYSVENGEYVGYARELLDAFAASTHHHFIYKSLPIKRLLSDLLSGQIDFKYPDNSMWASEERKGKTIYYSQTTAEYIDGIMLKAENKGKGLSSIKSLGVILGFTPFDYIDKINSGAITVNQNHSLTPLLKSALAGRVDGAYVNVDVAAHQLQKMGNENQLVFDETLPHSKGGYVLSSLKHKNIVDQFNEFLEKNPDTIAKLKEKYRLR